MKKNLSFIVLLLIGFAIAGCSNEVEPLQVPEVATFPVTDIAYQSATCGGYVKSEGSDIVSLGICWGSHPNPTIDDSIAVASNEDGSFTIAINQLKPDSTYYVRAFATNSAGTGYGSTIQFKTKRASMIVLTAPLSEIGYQSATSGGLVTAEGTSVTACGVCWSTKENPTLADSMTVDGHEAGSFTSVMKGLIQDSTYFVRAYATNGVDTVYGSAMKFRTKRGSISVTTLPVYDVEYQTALCGGSVTGEGTTVTSCGICWGTGENPTLSDSLTVDGHEAGSFSSLMKGLKPDVTYYVKAYATNGVTTVYGSTMKFKTKRASFSVTTTPANSIMKYSAVCGGSISNPKGVTLVSRGLCWSTKPYPTLDDNNIPETLTADNFSADVLNLKPNAYYYVRAYASSYNELIYGETVRFKTRLAALSATVPVISSVTSTSFGYSASVTSEAPSTILARGVCWGSSSTPTLANYKTTDGVGDGSFRGSISGLRPSATYYVRSYVTDNEGTVYGSIVTVKTSASATPGVPSVGTVSVEYASSTSAKLRGQIYSQGNATVTSYGYYCSRNANPIESNSESWGYDNGTTTSFSMTVQSLTAGVTYYLRAFAKNSYGTGYGNVISYTP